MPELLCKAYKAAKNEAEVVLVLQSILEYDGVSGKVRSFRLLKEAWG